MPLGVRERARYHDIQITVPVEIADFGSGRPVHRKEIPLAKVVVTVIFQDPDSVVWLQDPGIVEVVPVHVENVELAVSVEVAHREVHRSVHGRKPRQDTLPLEPPTSLPVIFEQHDPFIALRE